MIKQWKDIKVGDVMSDGSVVTQVHRTRIEPCCKVTYDDNKDITCAYTHVFLIDISNLPLEGKKELDQYCTFVPLEENYTIDCDQELTLEEKLIVEQFCHNDNIDIQVDFIGSENDYDVYDFHFDTVKRIFLKNVITKSEPQKVDDNTYWLSCKGIEYLMNTYNVPLYCNGLIINKIESVGNLPCFCITTNTGKYET